MIHRIIVHEDKNPFIRMEVLNTKDDLKKMLARTHNGMLKQGYALIASEEQKDQRAATYKWVRTPEPQPRIHVTVLNE